jgi:hypothetical protein
MWIDTSVITIDLVTDLSADLVTLKNTVEDLVRAQVDAFGFVTQRAYDVEIHSGGERGSTPVTFGVEFTVPQLEPVEVEYEAVRTLSLRNPQLRIALSDLREAIRAERDTALFCARAIDSLKEHFRPEGGDHESAWRGMREHLNIDEDFLKALSRASREIRHARGVYSGQMITDWDRAALLSSARAVVARFVAYMETGKAPEHTLLRDANV